jgi:hypothetical protein
VVEKEKEDRMKKLFIALIMLLLIVVGCTEFVTEEVVKQIVKEEITNNQIQTDMVKIFPVETRAQKDDDFKDGIMYVDNSYTSDSLDHTIDLSPLVSKKATLVALQIRVVPESSGGNDSTETFVAKFKPNGMAVNYVTATCDYNNPSDLIWVITDEDGVLQWYSDYNWPYWANPGCEPGQEIYKWTKIEIWAVFYIAGTLNP